MPVRRFLYWLSGFQWWAVFAVVFALTAVLLAVLEPGEIGRIVGASAAAITLAILSTKESA
jgi:hypothetical protein